MDRNYHVTLTNIDWDREVDGENRLDQLPVELDFTVHNVYDVDDAIEVAVDRASDLTGFCILGSVPVVREVTS